MDLRNIFNPFLIYVWGFFASLLAYQLPWSEYYPLISIEIVLFFTTSFIFYFFTFKITHPIFKFNEKYKIYKINEKKYFLIVAILVFVNFSYMGKLPFLSSIYEYNYRSKEDNVMPFFYPLMIGAAYFFGCRFFVNYVCKGGVLSLFYSVAMIVPAIAFVQRGMAFSQLVTYMIIYIFTKKHISMKKIAVSILIIFFVMYIFGALGGVRDSGGAYYRPITEMAGASENFYNSGVSENIFYFWVYFTSPLANLVENTSKNVSGVGGELNDFVAFVYSELILDTISKRIVDIDYLIDSYYDVRIVDTLNVGTMYTRAYSYFGWIGMIIMSFYYAWFIVFYLLIIRNVEQENSEFFIIGMAMLSNLSLMMVFDNMLSNSARIFPLIINMAFVFFARREL